MLEHRQTEFDSSQARRYEKSVKDDIFRCRCYGFGLGSLRLVSLYGSPVANILMSVKILQPDVAWILSLLQLTNQGVSLTGLAEIIRKLRIDLKNELTSYQLKIEKYAKKDDEAFKELVIHIEAIRDKHSNILNRRINRDLDHMCIAKIQIRSISTDKTILQISYSTVYEII